MKKIIVAVDGTAGSGKSVTFQKVAKKLNYDFIDTGLMYRAFTLLGIWKKIAFEKPAEVVKLIPSFHYEVKKNRVFLNQVDVTTDLQQTKIVHYINFVTGLKPVRKMMVAKQQAMVKKGGVIMVGRDITSVVLPNADLKIYLDSSPETRAQRRYEQNLEQGIDDLDLNQIKKAIIDRDHTDQTRQVGALKKVGGTWVIDNSNLSITATVDLVVARIKKMEREDE